MGVAAVFLDAGYLDQVLYRDHGNARIDYSKLALEMAKPDQLLRAYYYNCLPYQSNPPTDDERARYAAKHRFITALRYLPRFEVRLGRLAYRGNDANGVPIFVQSALTAWSESIWRSWPASVRSPTWRFSAGTATSSQP